MFFIKYSPLDANTMNLTLLLCLDQTPIDVALGMRSKFKGCARTDGFLICIIFVACVTTNCVRCRFFKSALSFYVGMLLNVLHIRNRVATFADYYNVAIMFLIKYSHTQLDTIV